VKSAKTLSIQPSRRLCTFEMRVSSSVTRAAARMESVTVSYSAVLERTPMSCCFSGVIWTVPGGSASAVAAGAAEA
jgi:hypothetical protein